MRLRVSAAVLLAIAACAVEPATESGSEPEPNVDQVTQAMLASTPQNPIDPPVSGQGAVRMSSSQLIRLPTSWFLSQSVNFQSPHRLRIKTQCQGPQPERKDTGLLVVKKTWDPLWGWTVIDVRYNDDGGSGNVDWSCPTCSFLDLQTVSSNAYHRYEVHAFSNRRTKANCNVVYATNPMWGPSYNNFLVPAGWPTTTPMDLGGALVDVGAVDRAADSFEVKTVANEGAVGPARENTRMVLFDVGATTISGMQGHKARYVPVESTDQPGGDRDPRISAPGYSSYDWSTVCGNPPCPEPRHFLLIGVEGGPPQVSPRTITEAETTVSLVRGPENAAPLSAQLTVTPGAAEQCGAAVTLSPGRYTASIRAQSNAPYGENTGELGDACPLIDPDTGPACNTFYYRGNGNFRAFTMQLQARTSNTEPFVPMTSARQVPNGAFGCYGNDCEQLFHEDFDVWRAQTVRMCISMYDSRTTILPNWTVSRNAAGAELKAATLNVHHGPQVIGDDPGVENDAESRNMSNLLATRGRYNPNNRTVIESPDDAPFEWAADVLLLQEGSWISSLEQLHDQAQATTDLDWHFVWGHSKKQLTYASYNSVFTHELLVPGSETGSIRPAGVAGCNSWDSSHTPFDDGFVECYNRDSADGGTIGNDYETYSVPAKLSVHRWGGGDVPILFVSLILEPGGHGEYRVDQRREELASLIEALENYVLTHPELVGADLTIPDPDDDNIRIVLGGDFNIYPHMFGENRWFVRELRAAFGYAVDASAADRDSYENFYDMHAWRGVELDGHNGLPRLFTPSATWHATAPGTTAWHSLDNTNTWWWGTSLVWPHYYPYWAMTYHGTDASAGHDSNGSHERHDAFFLVGKGWAKDDPVRKYIVMNSTAEYDEYNQPYQQEPHGSPFAIRDEQGRVVAVDISPFTEGENLPNTSAAGAPRHYKPQFDLTNDSADGCTLNGCAAIETDHVPVGIRLRVTR